MTAETEQKKPEGKKPPDAMSVFRAEVKNLAPEFQAALPPQISQEKFTRVLLTAVQQTPDLLNVTRKSLWGACMKAAADGLLPDGREAALVIYNTKTEGKIAQYMPMTAGILKKVRNSGELATITSQIVHKNDKFRYWVDDDGEHILHEPELLADRGQRVGVYAMAKTKDDFFYFEFLTASQVEDIRQVSKAKDSGPWSGKFVGEMWRKSAIRRMSKRLPMSTDLEEVIRDDENLGSNFENAKDVTPPITKTVMDLMREEVPEGPQGEPLPEKKPEPSPSSSSSPAATVPLSSPISESPIPPTVKSSAAEVENEFSAKSSPSTAEKSLAGTSPIPPSASASKKADLQKAAIDLMSFLGWDNARFLKEAELRFKKSPISFSEEDMSSFIAQLKEEAERKTK